MVKTCIQRLPKGGYENAKQMMYKLHGDPHRVIATYRKEIKQSPGDSEAYRKFHIFLLNMRILHNCRHGMFWTLLKLCVCFCLNVQVEQETSGQGESC